MSDNKFVIGHCCGISFIFINNIFLLKVINNKKEQKVTNNKAAPGANAPL